MERAVIGVDGNCGFALLGENLQEGEVEFQMIALLLDACQDRKLGISPRAFASWFTS